MGYQEEIGLIEEGRFEEAFEPIEDGQFASLDLYHEIVGCCRGINSKCSKECNFYKFITGYIHEIDLVFYHEDYTYSEICPFVEEEYFTELD
jgi:hypothetical protein